MPKQKTDLPVVSQEEYVASGGNLCIYCKGTYLHYPARIEAQTEYAYQQVRCPNCGRTWQDEYVLGGYCTDYAEKSEVDYPCPHCGHELSEEIDVWRENSNESDGDLGDVDCPKCGGNVSFSVEAHTEIALDRTAQKSAGRAPADG